VHRYDRFLSRWVCLIAAGWLGGFVAAAADLPPAASPGLPPPAASPGLPPLPEDLIPALRPILVSALAQSPQMLAKTIDVVRAEGERISARSGLLPTLGTNLRYGSNTTTSTNGSSSSNSGFFYDISANQAIYHWGALKARADIGKIGLRIAERSYADAYRQLIVALRGQFLELVEKKIGLRNAEFAVQRAEAALATAKEGMTAKALPPGSDVGPQLAVDDARLTRDKVAEDLESSEKLFALSIGQPDFAPQNIPDDVPKPAYLPEVVTQLVQQFIKEEGEGTYAIANLHDSIKQADLNYQIARVGLRPMIGFSAFYSQQTQSQQLQNQSGGNYIQQYVTRSNNYNIVANWSIFDGLATRGAKLSTLSAKRGFERELRTTVDQTLAQARDLAQKLAFAWRTLDLAQRRRDMAEGGVGGATDYVKRGLYSADTIEGARMGFYQAELTLALARTDFLNQWSSFVSTLCVDPMLTVIPDRYLHDAK